MQKKATGKCNARLNKTHSSTLLAVYRCLYLVVIYRVDFLIRPRNAKADFSPGKDSQASAPLLRGAAAAGDWKRLPRKRLSRAAR